MKLHRAEAWHDLESDLKPLLQGIKWARMQAGLSVDDSMPVFHATDTYGRHRRCIRKCYAEVWSEMRQKVLALTPKSDSFGVEWQSPEESNLGSRCMVTGEPFHDVISLRRAVATSAPDCRDLFFDHTDLICR